MGNIEFKLPDIGEGVAEGEITKWHVKAGDAVTEDQVMVEVMTDKATVEIGSPVTGEVVELKAGEGDTIPVGDVIVVLAEGAGTKASAGKGSPDEAASKKAPASTEAGSTKPGSTKTGSKKARPASASAAASRLSEEPDDDADETDADGDEEVNFALPDIGEGVAEGEVTKWHVKAGDAVTEDQVMVEVMTDKATVEIGSPVDGRVVELLVEEGQTVPVGEVLLVLAAAGGRGPARAPDVEAAPAARAAPSRAAAKGGRPAGAAGTATATRELSDTGLPPRSDGSRRVRAAPAVRRLAHELGIEIGSLEGSGPQGRVVMDDVRAAQAAPARPAGAAPAGRRQPAPEAPAARVAARPAAATRAPARAAPVRPVAVEGDERVPLRGLRKRIAQQMRASKDTAAHFTYVEELDVTELVKLRKAAKAKAQAAGVNITFMPFIIKALVPALREFPIVNASLDEQAGELVYHHDINVGIAVDTDAGLIVPVVRQADTKSIRELAAEIGELAERGRAGKQRQEDFGGGTFTITNAGNIGGMFATPIINVPEVAILGVHAIRRRPWVVDEEIVIRDILLLSLSLDHRVVDGAVGAHFMNRVKALLENPALLLLEEI